MAEFSEKQMAFLECDAPKIFAEGTTYSGKTYISSYKILFDVMNSPYQEHIIVGATQGQVEKNVLGDVDTEGSFLWLFKGIVEYYPYGHGKKSSAHLLINCWDEINEKVIKKTVYVMGADNIGAISKIRGMNKLGIGYVDELNKINEQVARELSARCNERFIGTLNPDSPDLPIYDLVNKSRPLPEFADSVPKEIMTELAKGEADPNFVYFHFNFYDNPAITEEKIENKKSSFVEGSALFNSLILGLRSKAEGIVLSAFTKNNIINEEEIKENIRNRKWRFRYFSGGLDTSYSSKTDDTTALSFIGITDEGVCVILEEKTINNKNLPEEKKVYASDLCQIIDDFYLMCERKWGHLDVFYIDCADSNTIGEWGKFKRKHGSDYVGCACNKRTYDVDGRNRIVNGWLKNGYLFVNSSCTSTINEFYTYAYDPETGKVIDKNNHNIDSFNYSWTARFKPLIGNDWEDD